MMTDFLFAAAHHILIFAIFGALVGELLLLRAGMGPTDMRRVALLDRIYGVTAGLILIVGFSRANFAAKGWDYYAVNVFFWAKIGTFALIGVLSIVPTIRFIGWRRSGVAPADGDVAAMRRIVHVEVALFFLLPIFAAAMARGYGGY